MSRVYTVIETLTESFDIEVPDGMTDEELDDYIEHVRVTGDQERRFDGVTDVDWFEKG